MAKQMNNDIQNNFNETIINLIKEKKITSLLLAISGGQDSLCLIKLIENLNKKYKSYNKNIKLEYIYVDHQWKKDSKIQIQHIINYLKYTKQILRIYQIKNLMLGENKCRQYRYHTIIQHAIQYKQQAIITAHTCTDKTETFFHNLVRGTSIEGFSSLTLQRKVNDNLYILRPLIHISREELLWKCRKFFLPVWSDSTNYNYKIERNRIRNELIPYLKKYFHKDIEYRIEYFLKIYYHDNEYIKQSLFKLYLNSIHHKYIALSYKKIQKQNFGLQIKTIQFFSFHNFYTFLSIPNIIKIIKMMNKPRNNLYVQSKNLNFNVTNKWLYISINSKFK